MEYWVAKVLILHGVLLCDQNNIQAAHPGGIQPLNFDAPKNTDSKK